MQKLLAPDASQADFFGASVALSGDRALIGATPDANDGAGPGSGSASVYERDRTGTWVEVARLTGSDAEPADNFGATVAIAGDRALVGADRDGDYGDRKPGSAYVFERDETGRWIEVAKLTAPDANREDYFGGSVALSGDRALVGADLGNGARFRSGVAYVYERDSAGAWPQVARLKASDGASDERFGASVALSGDRALVGATQGGGGFYDAPGFAYVYQRNRAGAWREVAKLAARDGEESDFFGYAVALSGDRALVGAYGDGARRTGSAYVFERDATTTTWAQAAKLKASDRSVNGFFGSSVALSGDRALIRARVGSSTAGVVSPYVYERDGAGAWREVGRLTGTDAMAGDLFGTSIALDGDRALVGAGFIMSARFRDTDSGSAYVFDVAGLGDMDEDGVSDAEDNCPADMNPLQEDFDGDLSGDVCDLDDDNDGVDDTSDPFPLDPTRPGRAGVPSLRPGTLDAGQYGFRFDGVVNHRRVLERRFDASGSKDLLLTLTGFDIDIRREVRVLVNGTRIGFLSKTTDNERGRTQLTIARSLLNSTGNTLRFVQSNPGWRWGVTDLLLSVKGGS